MTVRRVRRDGFPLGLVNLIDGGQPTSSNALMSDGAPKVVRNETDHTSELNLRCFAPSTFPHSVHVFGNGRLHLLPCSAWGGQHWQGGMMLALLGQTLSESRASQPATPSAAGRQNGPVIAR
jgi:hypothetical protein